MKNLGLLFFLLFTLISSRSYAQHWSIGGGTGAFVFGNFTERTVRIGNEDGTSAMKITLSAKTRPGLAVDLERDFNPWFALRLQGTLVDAPLVVKNVGLDAGRIDVSTFSTPVVIHLNRNGAIRFHLLGGPAMASYHIRRTTMSSTGSEVPFRGSRSRWGAIAGGGVDWWLSKRFAAEGEITDIVTSSPFQSGDFPASAHVHISKPQNVHTTVGIRYRF